MALVVMKQARGTYASVGIEVSNFTNIIYQAVCLFFTFPDSIRAYVVPVYATCPTHLIVVLDFIDLMVFGEEYKS